MSTRLLCGAVIFQIQTKIKWEKRKKWNGMKKERKRSTHDWLYNRIFILYAVPSTCNLSRFSNIAVCTLNTHTHTFASEQEKEMESDFENARNLGLKITTVPVEMAKKWTRWALDRV